MGFMTSGDPPKVTVQVTFMDRVTDPSVQSASPLKLEKNDPGDGVAVSVTTVPPGKVA